MDITTPMTPDLNVPTSEEEIHTNKQTHNVKINNLKDLKPKKLLNSEKN